eukprot:gene7759-biopygen16580
MWSGCVSLNFAQVRARCRAQIRRLWRDPGARARALGSSPAFQRLSRIPWGMGDGGRQKGPAVTDAQRGGGQVQTMLRGGGSFRSVPFKVKVGTAVGGRVPLLRRIHLLPPRRCVGSRPTVQRHLVPNLSAAGSGGGMLWRVPGRSGAPAVALSPPPCSWSTAIPGKDTPWEIPPLNRAAGRKLAYRCKATP